MSWTPWSHPRGPSDVAAEVGLCLEGLLDLFAGPLGSRPALPTLSSGANPRLPKWISLQDILGKFLS